MESSKELTVEPWVETNSGRRFHLLKPTDDEINIGDIAYALANQCRYTGHCNGFYSVAEHCVYVASLLPPELRLAGLLHDAAEAYLGDVSSPLKRLLPDYRGIEHTVELAIATKFQLDWPPDPRIKWADLQQLRTEAYYLLPSKGHDWLFWEEAGNPNIEDGRRPRGVPPQLAYNAFMQVYETLTKSPIIMAA